MVRKTARKADMKKAKRGMSVASWYISVKRNLEKYLKQDAKKR